MPPVLIASWLLGIGPGNKNEGVPRNVGRLHLTGWIFPDHKTLNSGRVPSGKAASNMSRFPNPCPPVLARLRFSRRSFSSHLVAVNKQPYQGLEVARAAKPVCAHAHAGMEACA